MTYLNDPNPQPTVRQPRFRILNSGVQIPGGIRVEITNNSHYHADSFSSEFALFADKNYGIGWWEFQNQSVLLVDVQISLDAGSTWTSFLQGQVDHVQVKPNSGTVHIEGRDLSAQLIEARTQESFINQTSSQVATTLAQRHNLTPDVQGTTTLVNRYYEANHEQITTQFSKVTTEWDLLTFLAQREGFNVWVTGTTLHFKPFPDESSTPWVIQWVAPQLDVPQASYGARSNTMDLTLERSLTIAKDLVVKVQSWSSSEGRMFTKTARGQHTKSLNSRDANVQQYVFTFPNMSESAAQDRANKILASLTQHERVIEWEEPGNITLTAQNVVQLVGTGSGWDQIYYVESIKRSMSFDGSGFICNIRAKNTSPLTEVQE